MGFNAEYLRCQGVCHDSQTDPLDAPLFAAVVGFPIMLKNHRELYAQLTVKALSNVHICLREEHFSLDAVFFKLKVANFVATSKKWKSCCTTRIFFQ